MRTFAIIFLPCTCCRGLRTFAGPAAPPADFSPHCLPTPQPAATPSCSLDDDLYLRTSATHRFRRARTVYAPSCCSACARYFNRFSAMCVSAACLAPAAMPFLCARFACITGRFYGLLPERCTCARFSPNFYWFTCTHHAAACVCLDYCGLIHLVSRAAPGLRSGGFHYGAILSDY